MGAQDIENKVVTIPSAEEVMRRLALADNDPYMIERFYPFIAAKAGRELVARGVLLVFALAIHDFMQDGGYPPIMSGLMHLKTAAWIDALIDDKEVAELVKQLHQEALDATSRK